MRVWQSASHPREFAQRTVCFGQDAYEGVIEFDLRLQRSRNESPVALRSSSQTPLRLALRNQKHASLLYSTTVPSTNIILDSQKVQQRSALND